MILIIDNYDSFTYNLAQMVAVRGLDYAVVFNDKTDVNNIAGLKPEKIIISPGPGRPEEAGVCIAVVRNFSGKIPILGVCLGQQCIGVAFGAGVKPASRILHGKTSPVRHDDSALFRHVSNPVIAARYHSLVLTHVPGAFYRSAWDEHQDIMAIRHRTHLTFGVQFHPESFLMPEGEQIMQNFLRQSYGAQDHVSF